MCEGGSERVPYVDENVNVKERRCASMSTIEKKERRGEDG
jgi:hypothetical protein